MANKAFINTILKEMHHKYDEEFTFETFAEGQSGSPYMMILAGCRSYPDAEIIIRVMWNEQGERRLEDNFISYYHQTSSEAMLAAAAEQVYGECKVFYKPATMALPAEYTKEMTVGDFLSRKESRISIYIYLPPAEQSGDKEKKAIFLRDELRRREYAVKGLICYVSQEDYYHRISPAFCRAAYTEKKYITTAGIFLLTPPADEYSYLRWRDER